jgi:tRNA dimethylallyltransferase
MLDGEPEVWLIGGPTASGKSALALRLAEAIGAAVVNADSMQVYRDLRVLTARPLPEEEARAPHRLYGHVDGAEPYSVGRWQAEAVAVLAEPGPKVIVGGTGLYFRALTHGLAEMPDVPDKARAAAGVRLAEEGEATFRAALRAVDPEAERRIAPGDRQRLIRAVAVHDVTGRSLSAWRAETRPVLRDHRAVVVEPPRVELYRRCDARFETMLAGGALAEVARFVDRRLPTERPLLKAVGVRELAAHLEGRLSLEEAAEAAKRDTRRYAKRQLTWFRNQTPDWPRIDATNEDEAWGQFLALRPALTRAHARGKPVVN